MVHYRSFESGILRYGRDGASAISDKGQTVWNGSYDMATPKADTCGSSVVIADIGEKSLYVYKGSEDKGASFRVGMCIGTGDCSGFNRRYFIKHDLSL